MACRVAVQCVDHSVLPCFSVAEGEWFGEIEFVLNQVGRASASESGMPSWHQIGVFVPLFVQRRHFDYVAADNAAAYFAYLTRVSCRSA